MKIKISNKEKIEIVLGRVQKRAKSRVIAYEGIKDIINEVECYLTKSVIPRKNWSKTFIEYAKLVQCNEYNKLAYTADSTFIRILRGSKDWFIVDCDRVAFDTRRNGRRDTNIHLSDNGKSWLEDNCVRILEDNFKGV